MPEYEMDLCGEKLTIETGKYAKQANGAVTVRHGNTVVLVTATASDEPKEGIDFFPLTVDYEERLYAVGKIPGGFIKREGRPTDKATLAARLTDRPLRPLFPDGFRNAVHIVITVLSVDQNCSPDIAGIIGASAALTISDIPFNGPIGAVLVGKDNGELVINPPCSEEDESDLDLVVAGTKDAIMMVEAGANELPKDEMVEAILKGHEKIKEIVDLIEKMAQENAVEKMDVHLEQPEEELVNSIKEFCHDKVKESLNIVDKAEREKAVDDLKDDVLENFIEEDSPPDKQNKVKQSFEKIVKEEMRRMIIENNLRVDGRTQDEIREISCEIDLLPNTHGTGLFTRGQTQVLDVCTLGALGDMQRLDGLDLEESKRYMHHYNFPPFSVGEAGFMRGPSRREIGHGVLAERALSPMIPPQEEFPYTIRLVSEVLESNGSTSMGSVCASSLSLMDAGVPIKRPVSGIAMGLIKESDDIAILSDIQGIEDFLGDMDFKVAGTEEGITALQMDIKIQGITREILEKAITQGQQGYLYILDKMKEVIDKPRPELSPQAPRVITKSISPDKIRDVIGPGGKMINKIIDETGVKIDIESDGKIYIASSDAESADQALKIIDQLTKEAKPGDIFLGKVTRTENYGAFAEILPGKDGLIHISKLAEERVNKTEDVVKVGDEVLVKVLSIDDKGRINLSRKDAIEDKDKDKDKEKNKDKDKDKFKNKSKKT